MVENIRDWIKRNLIDVQETLADEIAKVTDDEDTGYEWSRLQDAFDLVSEAIDQLRYITDPIAYNTEVIEKFKNQRKTNEERIANLENQILHMNTELESYKMAISRANDTIKEQIGAIKILKELLKEV